MTSSITASRVTVSWMPEMSTATVTVPEPSAVGTVSARHVAAPVTDSTS